MYIGSKKKINIFIYLFIYLFIYFYSKNLAANSAKIARVGNLDAGFQQTFLKL